MNQFIIYTTQVIFYTNEVIQKTNRFIFEVGPPTSEVLTPSSDVPLFKLMLKTLIITKSNHFIDFNNLRN